MAKIFIYDKDKNIIEELDSEGMSLDDFLAKLIKHATDENGYELRIEECFDSSNTYFNTLFVPNVLRMRKLSK